MCYYDMLCPFSNYKLYDKTVVNFTMTCSKAIILALIADVKLMQESAGHLKTIKTTLIIICGK